MHLSLSSSLLMNLISLSWVAFFVSSWFLCRMVSTSSRHPLGMTTKETKYSVFDLSISCKKTWEQVSYRALISYLFTTWSTSLNNSIVITEFILAVGLFHKTWQKGIEKLKISLLWLKHYLTSKKILVITLRASMEVISKIIRVWQSSSHLKFFRRLFLE